MKQLIGSLKKTFLPSKNVFIPVNNAHVVTSSSQSKNESKDD